MPPIRVPVAALALLATVGCAALGPRTIETGRFDYNQAIARTADEQMLLNLVRLHYRDTPLFLEVSSVSTQYAFEGSAGLSATAKTGVEPDEAGASTGIAYAERPTVVYTPLQGEKFLRQVLSPVPLESIALLRGSGWSIERIFRTCVQRVNDVWNAPGASGPTPDYVPRYREFRELSNALRRLQLDRAFEMDLSSAGAGRIDLVVSDGADVAELHRILGTDPEATRIPMAVTTRSLLGVLFYLSHSVETPGPHREAGLVTVTLRDDGSPFDWTEVTGGLFRVRSSETRPSGAFVAVRYRGFWFWIADDDLGSKSTFGLVGQLFSLQSGDVAGASPLLTLPVGR